MEEKNIFNYDELEKKYNIHINYPGKAKTSFKLQVMSKLCCIYRNIREKTLPVIPMGEREEFYWQMKEQYHGRVIDNSVKGQKHPYVKMEFIHMYDFIPKERMEKFVNELAEFKKNMLNLTTSLNAIVYTVALNEKLVESLNQIFINHIGDFYYMHCGNLKWYEFYKMGWGNYSGHVYKRTFINDCIQGIKWNVINLIKKDITIYLISNKMTVFPSVNVYKTNINGNSNTEFWISINTYSPNFCDFIKDYGA